MSATRRFYLYLIALITLVILSIGVGQLLALLSDVVFKASTQAQVGAERFNVQQLSLGVAMIVIAGPLWYFFWRSVQRRAAGNADEIGSGVRKLYFNLLLTVSFLTALSAAAELLRWVLAGAKSAEMPSGTFATFIVTGVIWALHWRLSEGEGHPSPAARTLRRWYVYISGTWGLVWLVLGLVQFTSSAVLTVPFWDNAVVGAVFWNDSVRFSIAMAVLGGLSWYFHWFRMAKGDSESTLRQVYYYLITISGGAVAALVAMTVTLHRVFVWVFGGVTGTVARHFQVLSWSIPTILIGAAVWGYHQRLVQEEQAEAGGQRQSAQRVHLYLMSFITLGAMVAGLLLLFGALIALIIGAAAPPVTVARGLWQDMLGLCLALLIVGTPPWLYYWGKVLRRAETGGIEEWRALSRRFFLYSIVAIGVISLAGGLVSLLYQIINAALLGEFGIDVLRNARWSIQIVLVAAPLLWYHWRMVRADQKRGAETPARKSVTLLTSDRTGALASRLGEKLGSRVRLLYRIAAEGETEPALSDEDLAKLAQDVEAAAGTRVMLVTISGKMLVLPYQEK